MKIIAKTDDYGNFLVQVSKHELARICPMEADKMRVGDELKLNEGVQELDAIRHDRIRVERIAKELREAASRLERANSIQLLHRPQRASKGG